MLPALATALLVGAAPACGPLDLDDALALAVERSDEVAIKESEVAGARADEALARALRILPSGNATLVVGPSPEARGNVLRSENSNRSLHEIRPFGRLDVQVVQPLYTWGRLDAARDAAEAGVDARQRLAEDTASQVQLRVVQLYWGVSLARRFLLIAADVDKALDEAEKRVQEALAGESGDVSPSDAHRLALFRGIVRGRQAEARRGQELARIGLAATLALPPDRLALKEEDLPSVEGDVPAAPDALARAERQRPDLRALDDALVARRAQVRAEEGARLPQVFAAGLFSYGYAPNRDIQLNPWVRDEFNVLNLGAVVGLRQDLSFPLLGARVEKARAETATLERQRAGLVRLVSVQVEGAVADVRAARERLVAARASLGSGRSLFRSVGLDFATGLAEAKTLIDSYGLYVESQVAAAQAAYDLVLARARLAQLTGEPVKRGTRCELPLP